MSRVRQSAPSRAIMDAIALPENSITYGCAELSGQTSIMPPCAANIPRPAARSTRSYPKSMSRRTSNDGLMARSFSKKMALSRHHGFVRTAFLIASLFSENHKSPRSIFWGDTDTIRSSRRAFCTCVTEQYSNLDFRQNQGIMKTGKEKVGLGTFKVFMRRKYVRRIWSGYVVCRFGVGLCGNRMDRGGCCGEAGVAALPAAPPP